jgi:rod shape-determining protein MreC
MKPVNARVVLANPNVWYSTVNIDRGSGDGVRVNDPVVNGDGLVGHVTETVSDAAKVLLITDSQSGVSARIADPTGVPGFVQTGTPGDPNDLLMTRIPRGAHPHVGAMVVTAGVRSTKFPPLFPADIPVGVVSRIDPNELDTSQQIHIRPYANMHDLDVVQVLTQPFTRSASP